MQRGWRVSVCWLGRMFRCGVDLYYNHYLQCRILSEWYNLYSMSNRFNQSCGLYGYNALFPVLYYCMYQSNIECDELSCEYVLYVWV